jgi:hypothetical protein
VAPIRNRLLALAAFVAAIPSAGFFLMSFSGHPALPGLWPTLVSAVVSIVLVAIGIRLLAGDQVKASGRDRV